MKRVLPFLIPLLISCDDTTIISEDDIAGGLVAGQNWVFSSGGAIQDFSSGKYQFTLLSQLENSNSDPCGTLFPTNPHIQFKVNLELQNTPLPISPSSDGVKFLVGGNVNNFVTATSGFIQITGISPFEVQGIIEASFDGSNSVSGVFVVSVCN